MWNIEKYLRVFVLMCIFAIPSLVLYVADWSFFPYIVGKNLLFRVLVELAFSGWILLILFGAIPKVRATLVHVAVGVFVIVVAIADFTGVAPLKSFWSNFERMEGLITMLHLFMYFVVLGSILNTEALWDKFWKWSLVISVVVGIDALSELSVGYMSITGPVGNSAYLAIYAVFHIFIAALYIRRSTNTLMRFVYAFIMMFNFTVLWFTGVTGALLGLLVGSVLPTIYILHLIMSRAHTYIKVFSMVVIVALAVIAGFYIQVGMSTAQDVSTLPSKTVFEVSMSGVMESPLLGWGQDNFNYVFDRYHNSNTEDKQQWSDRIENVLLGWLVASGLLGLVAYLLMYASVLFYSTKVQYFNMTDRLLLIGLLIAYAVHNLFVFDYIVSYILFFSLAAWVHSGSMVGAVQHSIDRPIEGWLWRFIMMATVGIVSFLFIFFVNYPSYTQNNILIKAVDAYNDSGDIDASRVLFLKASNDLAPGTKEVREQFIQVAKDIHPLGYIDMETKVRFLDAAINEMKKQKRKYPEDSRYPYVIYTALSVYGRHDEAVKFLEEALSLSPNKVSLLVSLADNAYKRGKYNIAIAYYKRAAVIEPNNKKIKDIISIINHNHL